MQIDLPNLTSTDGRDVSYVNYIGYAIIDYIELYINTTKIDRLTGEWLYIYNELTIQEDKKRGYNTMIGGKDFLSYNTFIGNQGGTYIIPLNFWFNNEIGLIYILHLQYSDIEIKIKFKDFEKLWISDDGNEPLGKFKVNSVHVGLE